MLNTQESDPLQPPRHFGFAAAEHHRSRSCHLHARAGDTPCGRRILRRDLQVPLEAWGTIKGATAKLAWFERVDAAIAAE